MDVIEGQQMKRRPDERREARFGLGVALVALVFCGGGLFAWSVALGWIRLGGSDLALWVRAGVAVIGSILLAGGLLPIPMLVLFKATSVEVSEAGLRLPVVGFRFFTKGEGEFIDRRSIAGMDFRERAFDLLVILRTESGQVKTFRCRKDFKDRLSSLLAASQQHGQGAT